MAIPPVASTMILGLEYEKALKSGTIHYSEKNRDYYDDALYSQLLFIAPTMGMSMPQNYGYRQSTVQLDCARTALAVECYRIERGVLPDSLDALVPDYIDAIPDDFYIELSPPVKEALAKYNQHSYAQNLNKNQGREWAENRKENWYSGMMDGLIKNGYLDKLPEGDPLERITRLRYVKRNNEYAVYSIGPDLEDNNGTEADERKNNAYDLPFTVLTEKVGL